MNECDSAYVADIIAIPEIDGTCFQMVIDDNLHTYIQVFKLFYLYLNFGNVSGSHGPWPWPI